MLLEKRRNTYPTQDIKLKCYCYNDISNLYDIINKLENKVNELELKIKNIEENIIVSPITPRPPLPKDKDNDIIDDFNFCMQGLDKIESFECFN